MSADRLVRFVLLVALVFATATPGASAAKARPYIVVADEAAAPDADLTWGQPAHVTYSGSMYASFECDNAYGHAVWRSGVVNLTEVTDIPILVSGPYPEPYQGVFYYYCEASLLGGGGRRHVIAVDPFVVLSTLP